MLRVSNQGEIVHKIDALETYQTRKIMTQRKTNDYCAKQVMVHVALTNFY